MWTLAVATATTDSNGKYAISMDSDCQKGADLYNGWGNNHMLVAWAIGYETVSSVNIGRTLTCTDQVQRVDFSLRIAPP